MTIPIRILLIVGAVAVFAAVLRAIKRKRIQMEDAIFWVVSSFLLVIVAIVPGILYFFSDLLGFQAPINFTYLVIIALLLVKSFMSSVEISRLKAKLNTLAQDIALDRLGHVEKRDKEKQV